MKTLHFPSSAALYDWHLPHFSTALYNLHHMDNRTWICDSCEKPIIDPEHGWVEWLGNQGTIGRGLRLVHKQSDSPRAPDGQCRYDDDSCHNDFGLSDLLGPDGLMQLLEFLADGTIIKEEVLEMIKRLHIPGYEHARLHFDAAIAEGVFEPNTASGYYSQEQINAVLEWLSPKHTG